MSIHRENRVVPKLDPTKGGALTIKGMIEDPP
jgi:hypothetical protein